MQLTPYIIFKGQCESALHFYEKALNGQIQNLSRFGDVPYQRMGGDAQKIMHAQFAVDGNTLFMASDDDRPDAGLGDSGMVHLSLNFTDAGSYYGDAVFGKSPWLDSSFGLTEYGHRGVPNVFLNAPLKSDGTWNSAHFKNKEYDQLVTDYVSALDLQSQRAAAKKIQELLLDEVPIVFAYFYFYLTATKPSIAGVDVSAMGHCDVSQAGQKA